MGSVDKREGGLAIAREAEARETTRRQSRIGPKLAIRSQGEGVLRGRKPKPAAVRALHGSKSRPTHHDEPTIPDTPDEGADPIALSPPIGLVAAERVFWREFAPLLAGARVLTPADVQTLADYCRACAAVDERGRRLRTVYRKRELDIPLARLLDSQLRGWVDRKTKLAGELALTAISRTRVAWSGHHQVVDPVKKPLSKLAQLQQQAASLRRPVQVR